MLPTELADRFVAAIEAGDTAELEQLLADELVVWANFTNAENDRATTLAILRWLHRNLGGLHYEIVERVATSEGYVQRHILRGTAPDGTDVAAPACLIVTVRDGRITRIAEYLDSAHIRALLPQP